MGIICPPPVQIGLTDLPNIGGASGPPGPPGSGTTAVTSYLTQVSNILTLCFLQTVELILLDQEKIIYFGKLVSRRINMQLKTLSKIERKKGNNWKCFVCLSKNHIAWFFCLWDLDVSVAVAAAISLYGFIRNFLPFLIFQKIFYTSFF